ncbi:MAG: anthranilate synthase component [Betaproteobacteria bacterium]|nr:anthranilate synthase component [Betaproteobacteria bacterium]
MTETEFTRLADAGFNRVPLVLETFADLDTPLSIYLKLANEPYTYLLESVVGGERFGRYSFIGLAAASRLEVRGYECVEIEAGREVTRRTVEDPLAFVQEYLDRYKTAEDPRLPRFCGGLVGYFGYEIVQYIEKRLARTPKADPLGVPDIVLLVSEEIAIVDNLSGKLSLVVYAKPGEPEAYSRARERLAELLKKLRAPVAMPPDVHGPSEPAVSGFGRLAYHAAVDKAKRYIYEGDVMQVVPSQRMSKPFRATPLSLYRALRTLNPSPYMYYFDLADFHIVGASPEILVRLEGENVTVRPIAGTRRRGVTPEEDAALAEELLTDAKERAEHIMLVDLGRNDAGRVTQTGTVRVTEQMVVERYSHVMHIVSNVEGKLKPGLKAIDVLRATFPAGTVSGAPKVRAMEIIDELEPVKRGVYAGAVGYLGFHGNMDVAIALRTAVIKDGTLYVQAGGGVVADSEPEAEWQETQNKARALLRAAEMAESGLDTRWD